MHVGLPWRSTSGAGRLRRSSTSDSATDMDTPHAIPPAWHDDPAGSGGERWWDGTAWTEHVRPREVPAFPVAPAFPVVQTFQPVQPVQTTTTPVYRPFDGPGAQTSPGWYADSPREHVVTNNAAGWTSLVAGVAGLGVVVVSAMVGQTVYVLYFPLIVAIGSGIRALAQRAAGKSTSLFAPIFGILFGAVAGAMFLSVVLTGAFPWDGAFGGREDVSQLTFPSNPELEVLSATASDVALGIYEQYPEENWPASLTSNASGEITLNGVVIGTIKAGQSFRYTLLGDSYTFTLQGTVPGERLVYDSAKNLLTIQCLDTDTTCTFTESG